MTKFLIAGLSEKLGFEIQLRTDEKVAVSCRLDGDDALAVLLTGFVMASNDHATPLNRIKEDL